MSKVLRFIQKVTNRKIKPVIWAFCFLLMLLYAEPSIAQMNATEAAYRHYVLGDYDKAYNEIQKAVRDNFFNVRPEPWHLKSAILNKKFEQELNLRFGKPDIEDMQACWLAIQSVNITDRNQQFKFKNLVQTEKAMLLIHTFAQKKYQQELYSDALKAYRIYAQMHDFLMGENYRNIPVKGLEFYGKLLQREGNRYEALSYYEKLIERKATDPEIYLATAQLYKSENQFEEAFEIIRRGRTLHPVDYDLLAEALNLAPFIGQAEELLEDLLIDTEKHQEHAKLQFVTAGLVSAVLEDTEKAASFYLKAIEINPEYYDAYFNLAVLYHNEAVAINEEMMSSNVPENRIAEMQLKRNRYYEQALPYFKKALEIRPGDHSVRQLVRHLEKVTGSEKEKAGK